MLFQTFLMLSSTPVHTSSARCVITSYSIHYTKLYEFVTSLRWSLGALDDEQERKARHYYDKVIAKEQHRPKPFNWAFISWKTEG